MRWEDAEIEELQDPLLQQQIVASQGEYRREFDRIYDTFRANKYEAVLPGILGSDTHAEMTKEEMEKQFYIAYNTVITRCFGWGVPRTSLVPFADLINHHNIDSIHQFVCSELHKPLAGFTAEADAAYSLDLDHFIEDNQEQLELDQNPDAENA